MHYLVSIVVDLIEISAILAAAGVLVGVVYYVLDIRSQNKVRQTELILQLYSFYNSETCQKALTRVLTLDYADYNDFANKYGAILSPSPNEVQVSVQMVATFFEGVGVLLSQRLLDIRLVQKLFDVKGYWKKIEPLAIELRRTLKDPRQKEWFEYLYNEICKIE